MGWGSLLKIKYDDDFGHVEEVYRVMTAEDRRQMKSYISFLELDFMSIDTKDLTKDL